MSTHPLPSPQPWCGANIGGMRSPILGLAIMVAVVASSCSTQVHEVRTNSGGVVDCPSDTVLYAAIDPVPDAAVSAPADALVLCP